MRLFSNHYETWQAQVNKVCNYTCNNKKIIRTCDWFTKSVVKASKVKKNDEDAYNNLSKTLQSLAIIFLAFILFFSYILVPYYFMSDRYQSQKNIVYFLPMIGNNLSFIMESFEDFTGRDSNYLNNSNSINTQQVKYTEKIKEAHIQQLYDHYNKNISVPKSYMQIKLDNASLVKTYPSCYLEQSIFTQWTQCNAELYMADLKKAKYAQLDQRITRAVDGKINNVNNLVENISLYDESAAILNVTDLNKWKVIINDWKQLYSQPSNIKNISYFSIANYLSPLYYAQPPNSPKDRQNLTANIENEIKTYAMKLESLEYPIVGKVPLVNLNGAFLSFPFLIAIGFSFLSLQFKKLIRIRKDLNLDNKIEKDKILMSWIDPLQSFPERIFPLVILILPFILFVLFLFFIGRLWYEGHPYMLGLLSGDLLRIPDNIKDLFSASFIFGALILGFSYGQILIGYFYPRR